MTIALRYKNKQ